MHRHLAGLIAGASLMLPLVSPAFAAQSATPAEDANGKPGAVAYPDSPSGTPAATNKGAPVVTDKAACPSGTKCADKPAPSGQADSATTGGDAAQSGGVRTPSTAYPNSPIKTPAAEPSGTAPK